MTSPQRKSRIAPACLLAAVDADDPGSNHQQNDDCKRNERQRIEEDVFGEARQDQKRPPPRAWRPPPIRQRVTVESLQSTDKEAHIDKPIAVR